MTSPQFAERNLSRIGLISALTRVSEDMTSWSRNIETSPFGSVKATCNTGGGHVVPHGLDHDLMYGVSAAFHIQGCPADNTICLSTAELITLSNLTKSGRLYQQVQISLDRLLHTNYYLQETWCDAQGNAVRTVNIALLREVSSVDEPREPKPGPYSATTRLKIVLDPALADSIRQNYLNELNPAIYRNLSRPMSRTLYRLLSEYQLNSESDRLTLNLNQLSQLLGYPEGHKAAYIQRDLTSAHTELLAADYLKEVVYTGRGKTCTVHYTFSGAANVFNSKYVEMLISRGISKGAAIPLLVSYSESEITAACQRFDELVQSGYSVRNRGGLMSDLIRHPAKYEVQTKRTASLTTRCPTGLTPALPEPVTEPDEADRRRTYKNLLSRKVACRFGPEDQQRVETLYLIGRLDTADVQQLCSDPDPGQALEQLLAAED